MDVSRSTCPSARLHRPRPRPRRRRDRRRPPAGRRPRAPRRERLHGGRGASRSGRCPVWSRSTTCGWSPRPTATAAAYGFVFRSGRRTGSYRDTASTPTTRAEASRSCCSTLAEARCVAVATAAGLTDTATLGVVRTPERGPAPGPVRAARLRSTCAASCACRFRWTRRRRRRSGPTGIVVRALPPGPGRGRGARRHAGGLPRPLAAHDVMDLDEWKTLRFGRPDLDLCLWWVAWDGDEVAGAAARLRRLPWAGTSTSSRCGGRGAAEASVAPCCCSPSRSCAVAASPAAYLGVDTLNPTGAMHLYGSVGMRPVRGAHLVFEKRRRRLTPSRSLLTAPASGASNGARAQDRPCRRGRPRGNQGRLTGVGRDARSFVTMRHAAPAPERGPVRTRGPRPSHPSLPAVSGLPR